MKIKKGEFWRIATKDFEGIIEVLEDIKDIDEDVSFKAKVLEGKEISLRTILVKWRKKEDGRTSSSK